MGGGIGGGGEVVNGGTVLCDKEKEKIMPNAMQLLSMQFKQTFDLRRCEQGHEIWITTSKLFCRNTSLHLKLIKKVTRRSNNPRSCGPGFPSSSRLFKNSCSLRLFVFFLYRMFLKGGRWILDVSNGFIK